MYCPSFASCYPRNLSAPYGRSFYSCKTIGVALYLDMTFLDFISEKGYSVYKLSKKSGLALTTLQDIASGKNNLEDCKGKTLLSLSRALKVSIEDLLSLEREEATGVFPEFLSESITEYRVKTRKESSLAGECWEQLRSSINVAEVENLISHETATRLRKRYYFIPGEKQ